MIINNQEEDKREISYRVHSLVFHSITDSYVNLRIQINPIRSRARTRLNRPTSCISRSLPSTASRDDTRRHGEGWGKPSNRASLVTRKRRTKKKRGGNEGNNGLLLCASLNNR